ncbi:hypothetical protein [Glycomyces sp. MUSA5-2]|uniref:hypothetical protein n=1 Tax=Glycomyces sp. MUSA5-2 TaxID=2053002 RepID=UPI00300A18CE
MAAKQPDPATRKIAEFLSTNPGVHGLDAIAQGTGVSKQLAGKILNQLATATPPVLRVDGTGTAREWTWILPAPAAGGTEAAKDPNRPTAAPAAPAAPSHVSTGADTDPDASAPDASADDQETEPEVRDADQMVMHAARTLAGATGPLSTAEIAAAGYVSATSLHLLTALRALAHQGLIECSRPFDPQSEECTWAWKGTDTADLLDQAAKVQPDDAPDQVACPECGTTKAIPGMPKGRKPGSGLRGNGTSKLAKDQLSGLVREFLEQPDNAGESYKIGEVVRELRAQHGDLVSKHSYGSVSKVMAKLTEPPGKDQVALLTLENEKPITYRVRDLT